MEGFFESTTNPEKISPVFGHRIAHPDSLMVIIRDFTNGPTPEPDKPHSRLQEQITFVAEEEPLFFPGEEKLHLRKEDIYTVPSGIPPCIKNISSHIRLADTFHPVRDDFLKK